MSQKSYNWSGICYLDSMCSDWQLMIPDLLHVPFAYGIHDSSQHSEAHRILDHVHIVISFPDLTSYDYALSVFNSLSRFGFRCCPSCQAVVSLPSIRVYLSSHSDSFIQCNGFERLL